MLISSINKFFAKHARITYLFIGVIIIIPFVFLYGDFGTSWQGMNSRNPKIGEVYGKSISRKDFIAQLKAIKIKFYLDYQRYLGANDDQIIQLLSKEILNRFRALHKARELGIERVSNQEIKDTILNSLAFQNDGKFDPEKFSEFKENILRLERLSAKDFDRIINENIIVDRIEKRITESVTTSDLTAKAAYFENFTNCQAQVSNFYSYKYLSEIKVTEEEVEKYFKENLDEKYRVPEQNKIQVVSFNSNDYMNSPDISEDQILAYYEENRAAKYAKKQTSFRHILIKSTSSDTEEIKKEKKEKLLKILNDLKEDKDFQSLAKNHSEDVVSSKKGGDLGYLEDRIVEARYGKDFKTSLEQLGKDEISSVIESKLGYHLVQKNDDRDAVPLSEVKSQIIRQLQNQQEEEEAKEYYEANKAEKYSEKEVHARHILLKTDPDDPDSKSEKRKEMEKILGEAKEKGNFAELAKLHSADTSNASKGGDLGFFGRGKMVKPFEDTAFSMKMGEISDIVETQFGYHIIEKLGERDGQPFEDSKSSIVSTLKNEKKDKAKEIALENATDFAIAVHSALQNKPNDQNAKAFVEFCNEYSESSVPLEVVESGFFTSEDYAVPNISGNTRSLAKEAANLNLVNPISEVIESGDYYFVCAWQSSKESYLPEFKEKKKQSNTPNKATDDNEDAEVEMQLTKEAKKAEKDLKNEKSIARAREECRLAFDEINAKLESGLPFEEAKGEITFTDTGEFVLSRGPRAANAEIIKSKAQETKANSLVAPQEIANGALLIFIQSHSLPTEEDYEKTKSFWLPQFRVQQQQTILDQYYQELEAESNTFISDDWQFLFETDTPKTEGSGSRG